MIPFLRHSQSSLQYHSRWN